MVKNTKPIVLKDSAVYMLVGFSFQQVAAAQVYHRINTRYLQHKKKGNTPKECKKLIEAEFGDFKKEHLLHKVTGVAAKGIFPTKSKAQQYIKKFGGYIHEAGYYVYYLIEKRPFGFDAISHDEDTETWYKGRSTGKGWTNYKYYPCKKPKFYVGTCMFSG